VSSVALSSDGALLSTGVDGTARLWSASGTAQVIAHERGVLLDGVIAPDGGRVAVAGRHGSVWTLTGEPVLKLLPGHNSAVSCIEWSASGRIATASWDGTAGLWDANTGARLRTIPVTDHRVTCVAFSPDGARLVTGAMNAQVWDVAEGSARPHLRLTQESCGRASPLVDAAPQSMSFSYDGASVVVRWPDADACIWNCASGELTRTITAPHEDLIAWAATGSSVRALSAEGRILTWIGAGEPEFQTLEAWASTLPDASVGALFAAFCCDGRRVAVAHAEGRVAVWDVGHGRLLYSVEGDWLEGWGRWPNRCRLTYFDGRLAVAVAAWYALVLDVNARYTHSVS
jgi:WD40 repeat protein